MDPDSSVCEVAAQNLRRFGWENNAAVVAQDAKSFAETSGMEFDLAVLDAEGAAYHPDPEWRGKRIYAPLMARCSEWLTDDAIVVAHNVMLKAVSSDPYMLERVAAHHHDLQEFLGIMRQTFRHCLHFSTTEGLGVFTSRTT